MHFGTLPPEVNSGLMYAGSGGGPMLAAASAWDGLAAELHNAAAGYNSVVAGLTSEGWLGPASTTMAAAAAPYAAWMSTTAAQAEQTAAQARAAVAAYEAAFTATVPPAVVAANRTQLATLVATNVLGQNTPAIAANEAHYAEMWAQDVSAMYGYDASVKPASALNQFNQPPQTANPAGLSNQAVSATQAGAGAVASNTPTVLGQVLPAAATTSSTAPLQSAGSLLGISNVKDALSYGIMAPQNGSYLFSLINSLNSLMRAAGGGGAAAVAANAAGALSSGGSGLAGLGGFGSALTAGLGQSGTIGALSVPQAWAAASPLTGSVGSSLGGATLAAAHGATPNPAGLLNGMPMLANAAARGMGDHSAAMPRFDLRPSVIPMSPAAG